MGVGGGEGSGIDYTQGHNMAKKTQTSCHRSFLYKYMQLIKPLPNFAFFCFIFFSDQDKSLSTQCTLMTENECWISFNVVAGETGTTAYNLQIYGEFCIRPDSWRSTCLSERDSHLFLFFFTAGCPEAHKIPIIILGVSLSIVCIGLGLLVVWKVLVSVHDRKEVARFEAERSNAKWQSVRMRPDKRKFYIMSVRKNYRIR